MNSVALAEYLGVRLVTADRRVLAMGYVPNAGGSSIAGERRLAEIVAALHGVVEGKRAEPLVVETPGHGALQHRLVDVEERVQQAAPAVTDAFAPQEDGTALGLVTGGWYAASLAPYVDLFGDQLLVFLHDDIEAVKRILGNER